MFEFLAKNTGNEWAHFQTGEGGEDGTNYLFTSFSVNSVSHDYNVMEGKIRGYNHNHPNTNCHHIWRNNHVVWETR